MNPEPSPVVWMRWNSLGGWRHVDASVKGAVRYVLAPEGSVVLPAETAKAFHEAWERSETAGPTALLLNAIRAQGGAS